MKGGQLQYRGAKVIIHGEVVGKEADRLLYNAWKDLFLAKLYKPEGDVYRNCGVHKVMSVAGQDTLVIYPKGVEEEEKKKRPLYLRERRMGPALCYDLINPTLADFVGFYITAGVMWLPTRDFLEADPDRPHTSSNYNSTNPDGNPNQEPRDKTYLRNVIDIIEDDTEIEPLDEIGESGYEDDDFDYTTSSITGEFNPGLGGNPPSWYYDNNCPKNAGLGIACMGTQSGNQCEIGYFSSQNYSEISGQGGHFVAYKMKATGGGCHPEDEGDTYAWGLRHTYRKYNSTTTYTDIIMNNEVVLSLGTFTSTELTAEGNMVTGETKGTRVITDRPIDSAEFSDGYPMDSSLVKDIEGYDNDTTWILLYTTYTQDYEETQEIDPWQFAPFKNTFPAQEAYDTTQQYWVMVRTADDGEPSGYKESVFEFADPEIYPAGAFSGDNISILECKIFDYEGNPIFIFTWVDQRNPTAVIGYAAIYKGKFVSQTFLEDTGGIYHEVEDSLELGGYGAGKARAVKVIHDVLRQSGETNYL